MSKRNKYRSIVSMMSADDHSAITIRAILAISCWVVFAAVMLASAQRVTALSFDPAAAVGTPRAAGYAGDANREEAKHERLAVSSRKKTASAQPGRVRRAGTYKPVVGRGKKKARSLSAEQFEKETKPFDTPGEAQEF